MGIHYAVLILTYVNILVLAYGIVIYLNFKVDQSKAIINQALNNALSILAFGLLVVYSISIHPHTALDKETTSFLLIASKFISVLTLGISLIILSYRKT
ncbi:hypothetical protein [Bacillus rubiinfantis]|uniref:hypothetical protein n=1 Tax=Bacillus rubiinfantis TaxID=1499680 RepID=UPI0005AABB1D|nr:hypothetical protein [Bacillus rubiinfantis]